MTLVDPEKVSKDTIVPDINIDERKIKLTTAQYLITWVFMGLEFLVGCGGLIIILWYSFSIFILHNHIYIVRSRTLLELLTKYWPGFIFVIMFIFFRLLLLKITNLESVKGLKFRNNQIYSNESDE